jgi:sporulation protein YlmC with PRC-barrel domain
MLRVSDLVGKKMQDESGKALGRVSEIRTKNSRVTVLVCGAEGFLQRMTGFRAGTRVKWEQVRKIEGNTIICAR